MLASCLAASCPAASDETETDTVVWTKVNDFVESIQDNAIPPERGKQILSNLPQLLRGAALDWLVSVVQTKGKEHANTSVENLIIALQRQSRLDRTDAIVKLDFLRYITQNYRGNVDIQEWAMSFLASQVLTTRMVLLLTILLVKILRTEGRGVISIRFRTLSIISNKFRAHYSKPS